ncbi:hypothetical protein C8A05DRAFT_39241 [Staphylotrichum tortipilum]|uniref:Uncharacterized protein n=1 Tax=Staphylotrichum tortipilum TaxID=2831512 RepID=A0AAN6RNJ2_9PEZI|nr:hypothetical protein C8A05DRAFT_39241 [Staphylotrichum longicolle]
MKATFFLTMLGLAASAAANPVPGAEGQTLEQRACSGYAVDACQSSCNSYTANACKSTCGASNYNCISACQSSRLPRCKTCCLNSCSVC